MGNFRVVRKRDDLHGQEVQINNSNTHNLQEKNDLILIKYSYYQGMFMIDIKQEINIPNHKTSVLLIIYNISVELIVTRVLYEYTS